MDDYNSIVWNLLSYLHFIEKFIKLTSYLTIYPIHIIDMTIYLYLLYRDYGFIIDYI